MISMIIFIVVAVVIGGYFVATYNKGVNLRNYVKEAFSTMDVYLKQRWDLIPNLMESVKGYCSHEKELFSNIAALRSNSNYSQMSNSQKIETNSALDNLLTRFLALQENYPELKANESFMQFNSKLTSIEDNIAHSRKYYNGTVRELNTFTEMFPSNIVCAMFHITKEKLFEINDSERQNVKVDFSQNN